ncbi:hypothetical protein A0H81_04120 [Grifola frondosa]|uniref:N-acetyltransferase ESCO zinc-finger domain-containing protein n=1 Tax=Grifola frondosa TaxID=5627 RepID=A0A1C7MF42_GRIFR|nr:hypothetical protein A0H81_04120 [Grifola frondosa]
MTPKVKRTYGSRLARPVVPSSPPSELTSPPSLKRKRPLSEHTSVQNTPPAKKQHRGAKLTTKQDSKVQKGKQKPKQKQLTQLHFSLDTSVLRTCPLCDLSYTKGAPDDESLHRAHCARVRRGLEWGKEEQREMAKGGVEELSSGLKLKSGDRGRIICFRPDIGGKIGAKLTTLLETISLALSSPPLSPISSSSLREKIVGCVVAQRISTAMVIASEADLTADSCPSSPPRTLLPVDTSTNLMST